MIGCRLTLLSYCWMLQFGEPGGVEVREYVVPLLAFLKEAPLVKGGAESKKGPREKRGPQGLDPGLEALGEGDSRVHFAVVSGVRGQGQVQSGRGFESVAALPVDPRGGNGSIDPGPDGIGAADP